MSDIITFNMIDHILRLQHSMHKMLKKQAESWYRNAIVEISALYRGKKEKYEVKIAKVDSIIPLYDPKNDMVSITMRLELVYNHPTDDIDTAGHMITMPTFVDEDTGLLTADYQCLADTVLRFYKTMYSSCGLNQMYATAYNSHCARG